MNLMDIENDYFLVKIRSRDDYMKVLVEVIAYIRLFDLFVTLYKRSILTTIGEMIGVAIKIDFKTNSGSQRRFTRMGLTEPNREDAKCKSPFFSGIGYSSFGATKFN
ncbi:hypothetical protein Godav_003779, partial [Gossypium davidsonii]|nr:hypothetical protein [Gossypium davidsonii]